MHLITLTLISVASAVLAAMSTNAAAAPFAVDDTGMPTLASIAVSSEPVVASFAWAGENETFASFTAPTSRPAADQIVNLALVTGIAAPEPPAMVLAGMAIGGLFCGRSLLRRKRTVTVASEESNS